MGGDFVDRVFVPVHVLLRRLGITDLFVKSENNEIAVSDRGNSMISTNAVLTAAKAERLNVTNVQTIRSVKMHKHSKLDTVISAGNGAISVSWHAPPTGTDHEKLVEIVKSLTRETVTVLARPRG